MKKFAFGKFEVEFDALDLDFAKKLEELIDKADEKIAVLRKEAANIKMSDYIERYCNIIFEFFDEMFADKAENPTESMFGGKKSIEMCDSAFLTFVKAKDEAINEYQNKSKADLRLISKTPNRATRRAKKK